MEALGTKATTGVGERKDGASEKLAMTKSGLNSRLVTDVYILSSSMSK